MDSWEITPGKGARSAVLTEFVLEHSNGRPRALDSRGPGFSPRLRCLGTALHLFYQVLRDKLLLSERAVALVFTLCLFGGQAGLAVARLAGGQVPSRQLQLCPMGRVVKAQEHLSRQDGIAFADRQFDDPATLLGREAGSATSLNGSRLGVRTRAI